MSKSSKKREFRGTKNSQFYLAKRIIYGIIAGAMWSAVEMETLTPPPLPEKSEILVADRSFVSRCRTLIEPINKVGKIKITAGTLTKSRVWGVIWRADMQVTTEGGVRTLHRITCWRTADGHMTIDISVGGEAEREKRPRVY